MTVLPYKQGNDTVIHIFFCISIPVPVISAAWQTTMARFLGPTLGKWQLPHTVSSGTLLLSPCHRSVRKHKQTLEEGTSRCSNWHKFQITAGISHHMCEWTNLSDDSSPKLESHNQSTSYAYWSHMKQRQAAVTYACPNCYLGPSLGVIYYAATGNWNSLSRFCLENKSMWGTRPEKNTLVRSLMQKSRQDMMMVWTTAMAVSMERRGQGPGDSGGGRGRAEAEVIPGFEACLADCGKFLKRWEYQTTLSASWEICM